MAQGNTEITRVGNSVLAASFFIRGRVNIHAGATNTHVRLMIVRDKSQDGTDPTIAELSEDSTNIDSPLNMDNSHRFDMIRDRIYRLDSQGPIERSFKIYVPMMKGRKRHIKYTGGATTDTGENNLYVLAISDEATNAPTDRDWETVYPISYHIKPM